MKIRRHFTRGANRDIDVEDGRLTIAVRQILSETGIETSDVQSLDDIVVSASRDSDGGIDITSDSLSHLSTESKTQLVSLCNSIVAGTNMTGTAVLRFRIGSHGPVFISISSLR